MKDKNSLRIMYELFRDGRSSNATIAQKLGLSEMTVAKKIKAMTRDRIISIKAIPNPVKMGNHASAFIGLNVDITKIDRICEQLKLFRDINIVATAFGRFDLLIIVYFPDWRSLEDFSKTELKHVDGIRSINTFLISEIKIGYDVGFNSVPIKVNMPDFDTKDLKLISELMKNGRPQYTEMAKKLNTSISTISRRISALIDHGIIKIVAIPNHSLEYLANAFILLNVDFSKANAICETLASYPETHLVMRLMNDYDILLAIHLTNREELYEFITSKVGCIDGVLKSETFILANFFHFNASAMLLKPDNHIS